MTSLREPRSNPENRAIPCMTLMGHRMEQQIGHRCHAAIAYTGDRIAHGEVLEEEAKIFVGLNQRSPDRARWLRQHRKDAVTLKKCANHIPIKLDIDGLVLLLDHIDRPLIVLQGRKAHQPNPASGGLSGRRSWRC